MRNARGLPLSIDCNGVKLVDHVINHIDYTNVDAVVGQYYPECCRLVQKYTGAVKVLAFDHNLRGSAVQSWMNKEKSTQ